MKKIVNGLEALQESYSAVQTKFILESILQGNTPSEVFVDDDNSPELSLVWDKGHCFYFGGKAADEGKYGEVINFFKQEILTDDVKNKLSLAKIYYSSEEWERQLLSNLKELKPSIYWRTLYTHKLQNIPVSTNSNGFFKVKVIDDEILESKNLENVNSLNREIKSMWGTVENFLNNGFGYCTIKDNSIVCWCTSEYISNDFCGVGIETIEEYQRQGLASMISVMFVEGCSKHNKIPYWDSWKNNTPSVRTAEKAGFEKILDYKIILGIV